VTRAGLPSRSQAMDSLLAISMSSGQKVWPGRAVIRRRTSLASPGERASGMARLFEETRTNPDWVTGQVAHPARPTSSN
jgi:ribosomal protein L4